MTAISLILNQGSRSVRTRQDRPSDQEILSQPNVYLRCRPNYSSPNASDEE
ncbi:8962_t:CDS:2, partial [Rhizophagus irregularis]